MEEGGGVGGGADAVGIVQVVGLRDCVVFGVEIPGTEGRACMAVIPDPERLVDLATLYSGVTEKLPSYARPMFVRFVKLF